MLTYRPLLYGLLPYIRNDIISLMLASKSVAAAIQKALDVLIRAGIQKYHPRTLCKYGKLQYVDINRDIKYLCRYGHFAEVKKYTGKFTSTHLRNALKSDNKKLLQYIRHKKLDSVYYKHYNYIVYRFNHFESGDVDIDVKRLFEEFINGVSIYTYPTSVQYAYRHNEDRVRYFSLKYPSRYVKYIARSGNLKIFKLCQVLPHFDTETLLAACKSGNVEIVKIITKTQNFDVRDAIAVAAKYHRQRVLDYLYTL